jgi:hypothetical protein
MLASFPRIGFGSELLHRSDDFLASRDTAIWFRFSPAQRPYCWTMLAFLPLDAPVLDKGHGGECSNGIDFGSPQERLVNWMGQIVTEH